MATSQTLPRPADRRFDPVTMECPRCGLNLWRVLRKRALRNAVEHLACLSVGFAIGVPVAWHHILTVIRFAVHW